MKPNDPKTGPELVKSLNSRQTNCKTEVGVHYYLDPILGANFSPILNLDLGLNQLKNRF